jgi:hypothetical protein
VFVGFERSGTIPTLEKQDDVWLVIGQREP